jgi:hypothetical protein
MKYLVYFKTLEDNHRCLFNDDHFETLEYLPDTKDCHHYEVFKGYDATDDGLIKFKSDMIKWNEELKNTKIMIQLMPLSPNGLKQLIMVD